MGKVSAQRQDSATYPVMIEIPVLYGDLDPNRHVNNVAMGRFFEHARVMAHDELHLSIAGRLRFFVARVTIDYVAQARFGTPIRVGSRLVSVGGSSLTLEQAGWQGETCVAASETVLVRVVEGVPTRLPDELRELDIA